MSQKFICPDCQEELREDKENLDRFRCTNCSEFYEKQIINGEYQPEAKMLASVKDPQKTVFPSQ